MLHALQAAVALILLFGLPIVLEAPKTREGELAAIAGAVILVAVAIHGVLRFVRSRKPRAYLDSVIVPPKKPDVERTFVKPKDKA
jgi:hypothetical protein